MNRLNVAGALFFIAGTLILLGIVTAEATHQKASQATKATFPHYYICNIVNVLRQQMSVVRADYGLEDAYCH